MKTSSISYKVLSLMSGTSLDGVDIAYCEFDYSDRWNFNLVQCETVPYEPEWNQRLKTAMDLPAVDFVLLNVEYGKLLGRLVKQFCHKHSLKPDFVSSHGHTIFHQPAKSLTVQIGSGPHIAAGCCLPVICDFRTMDVAMGGQGAPLVPAGDKILFSEYNYCLNLGGIANISFEENGERKAFDICACNIVLNHFAAQRNLPYDTDGFLASKGIVSSEMLNALSSLDFYSKTYPKSLGREDIDKNVFPIIHNIKLSIEDVLATFTTHIAEQIANTIVKTSGKLLITGGGAFNNVLLNKIKSKVKVEAVVPEVNIINYKEAIIFGFLGVLRIEKQDNCLKSVTGARLDSCGGAVYYYNA